MGYKDPMTATGYLSAVTAMTCEAQLGRAGLVGSRAKRQMDWMRSSKPTQCASSS